MPTTFRPYEPDQMLLLAPDLRSGLGKVILLITSATLSILWT